jgi:hypothetical protein
MNREAYDLTGNRPAIKTTWFAAALPLGVGTNQVLFNIQTQPAISKQKRIKFPWAPPTIGMLPERIYKGS